MTAMHLRDRVVIGVLSVILVVLSGVVIAPSFSASGPDASPESSPTLLHAYAEGIVGSAVSVGPFSAQSVAERTISALLFRGLVRLGPDDTLVGDLADRWAVDATGAAWTFHLRTGLAWQDGEPITSEDVVFTIGALSDPTYTGPGAASWREVTATATDSQTVTLTLATPLGGFLQAATQGIAPAHLLAGVPPADLAIDPFGRRPVGSGPFSLTALDETHALLVPDVAQPFTTEPEASDLGSAPPTDSLATTAPSAPSDIPLPYLDGIEFRFFPDIATLTSAWRLGQIAGAAGLPASVAKSLAADGEARLVRYPSTTLFAVTLNLRPAHIEFRDPAVRLALLKAIDRDAIVRDVLGGLATRADGLIPPSSAEFDNDSAVAVPHDIGGAQTALLTAGWKRADGGGWIPKGAREPLSVEILSPLVDANPSAYAVAAAVAAGWRAIGLDVVHTALPGAELIGERLQAGDFDVAVTGTTIGLDPDLYPLLASSQTKLGGSNFSGLQDVALDLLLVKARAPAPADVRMAAYAALQVRLAASTYVLPIAFSDLVMVARSSLTGPTSRPVGAPGDRFWDVLTWRLAAGR